MEVTEQPHFLTMLTRPPRTDPPVTPGPVDQLTHATAVLQLSSPTSPPVLTGPSVDDEPFEAILGGVIAAIILLLCCCAFLVLRYRFSNKGSYLTNESGDGESIDMADTEFQRDTALLETVEDE